MGSSISTLASRNHLADIVLQYAEFIFVYRLIVICYGFLVNILLLVLYNRIKKSNMYTNL